MSDMMKLIGLLQDSEISISGAVAKDIIQGVYPEDSPREVSTHNPVKANFALSMIYKRIIGGKYEGDIEKFCFTRGTFRVKKNGQPGQSRRLLEMV
ncbi:hypothetical protein LIER_19615 [Lithospermum erythrorhizon]|uniref:Uncharacterized protein n=1 Tax=Lithospermum erythrorhizon TaxID=34254 RepID=A0AAV3QL19_LITER